MADLEREAGAEPETRSIAPEPSRTVLEPEKRIFCDHVADGEPIAGFVSVLAAVGEVLVDLCAPCYRKVEAGGHVTAYSHDRRHGQPRDGKTRPSSSTAEQPADNRQTLSSSRDEHRLQEDL